jgi:hypothetical protein
MFIAEYPDEAILALRPSLAKHLILHLIKALTSRFSGTHPKLPVLENVLEITCWTSAMISPYKGSERVLV